MKSLGTLLIIIFFSAGFFFSPNVDAQDLALATEYFNQGEFEKAIDIYSKLSRKKENSRSIHDNYLNSLIRLKKYDIAKKYLEHDIKNFPEMITYQADMANLLEISGNINQAKLAYDRLVKNGAEKDAYVYQLQNFFYKVNKMELLIDLFLKSRARSKSLDKHNVQLARAYLYAGNKEQMLEEVFSFGLTHQNSNYVQRTIQDNIKEEEELQMLVRLLYTKIQENPDVVYYNQILIWHFTQQKEFSRAFTQARALDRRLDLGGDKVYSLATLAYQNDAFRDASRMFQYIMTEYPNGQYYPYARRWNIQCREELVKTTFPIERDDILGLIDQYNQLLADLGQTPKTIDALRNMALLHAFYLNDQAKAVNILEKAIALSGSNYRFKDQCKLDLGDIYVLKEEPWESTLLYMQVEKSQKTTTLGELAKLKNAKLHYYTGEFELSKDILDILKKATTREIANDAMQLSLLIQDNLGLDTTDAAMKAYASVDLLIFRNKKVEALAGLDSLYQIYKSHSLADEILWLRAKTNYELNNYESALTDLNNLLDNYKYDILADDALFLKAKIYEEKLEDNSKAMALYRQILIDYPGSIHGAEARKMFRALRGDFVY